METVTHKQLEGMGFDEILLIETSIEMELIDIKGELELTPIDHKKKRTALVRKRVKLTQQHRLCRAYRAIKRPSDQFRLTPFQALAVEFFQAAKKLLPQEAYGRVYQAATESVATKYDKEQADRAEAAREFSMKEIRRLRSAPKLKSGSITP